MKDARGEDPRFFIDKNGGYQTARTGIDKEAHDAWVKTNSWNLTADDFIRLSYFHGNLEHGSDGSGPVNGSNDNPDDVVYISESGSALTRSMVSEWYTDFRAFTHGYKVCAAEPDRENAEAQNKDLRGLYPAGFRQRGAGQGSGAQTETAGRDDGEK